MTGAFFFRQTACAMELAERATDLVRSPDARVVVFVDGQNLYKRCQDLFGHALCHPHLLAQALAGTRRLVGVRFYTGRPDPNDEPSRARALDRRLAVMGKAGVTTITRPLRYHWDWSHYPQKLPKPGPGVAPQTVTLHPYQRPREKGIDLVIGLDVVEWVLTGACDVAIVVSLDRDLYEIPQALKNLSSLIRSPYRLEAAVPVPEGKKQPKILPAFSYTHQIQRSLFERMKDTTDYTAPEDQWTMPAVPSALPPLPTAQATLPGLAPRTADN